MKAFCFAVSIFLTLAAYGQEGQETQENPTADIKHRDYPGGIDETDLKVQDLDGENRRDRGFASTSGAKHIEYDIEDPKNL